ncbi:MULTISPECIES: NAD(P)/FAD-dependent oxidoreductase [unclassified Pseudodesulfovibrio]|uniref:NAD(P)/FAD-dependent oxidoreductase n=1 Tax=unclassified Pseudodesulfovibrio TaxID=2661612 RepID=UPI000FEBA5D8|nr:MULTISPECIES: NAD(P)/FAD-dependent oxidoreductase [unclassified Pseudodesulfovibrio]MCJ2163765.1 NAD(P)/FAD-dependent oxidoreductase [Pseudodesulfovibrio sp. S3-i]RWU05986.1 NAD(P)/FAD-dependent oxidoreductase [Pseudodesulfovibrio sp. S3]
MNDTDTPKGAILQRDKKTYAIVPRTPVGLVTPDILEALARVGRKFDIPIMKITSGQRIALVGLGAEQVDQVWDDLKMDIGPAVGLCVHYVQACPGTAVCKLGVRDSLGLGLELEEMFVGKELPAKLKVGVSGCPMCCAESYVRDVGLIGKPKGWTMVVGGNASGRPRIADEVASNLSRDEAVELVKRFLEYYREHGGKRNRSARMLEKVGIDAVKAAIL